MCTMNNSIPAAIIIMRRVFGQGTLGKCRQYLQCSLPSGGEALLRRPTVISVGHIQIPCIEYQVPYHLEKKQMIDLEISLVLVLGFVVVAIFI